MKTTDEFDLQSDIHTELDHACKVALATIHYTYKDTHDNHFVSEDEIIKIHKAIEVLDSAIKMKGSCKFTV